MHDSWGDQQSMKSAYASRYLWLPAILILTLALAPVDIVRAEALLWAVESNPGCGANVANAVAADGTSLYVVGFETHPYGTPGELNARQWRVEKRSIIDGALVWASAPPDVNTLPSLASGVAVDGSGVYVVGSDGSHGPVDFEWRIEKRSLLDGSPLWTVTSNPSSNIDEAYGVAIDASALYVVGEDFALGSFSWRIEKRSLSDGSLIWNVTSHPQNQNIARGVAVDDSGIYVVGESQTPQGVGTEWRTEKRRLIDGSLIWNATTSPIGDRGNDSAQSVAVDATGVYVVGGQLSPAGGFVWRVEKRHLADGSVVWNATSQPTPDQLAWGAAVNASGIYVVGYDYHSEGDQEWRIEKRNLADGSLMWDATSNPSPRMDEAYSVAVDTSGVYTVGLDQSPGNFQWRIEKRSLTDGSVAWTATSNPGTGVDEATAVANDGSAFYVVGFDSFCVGAYDCQSRWRVEKRNLADGSVIWTMRSHPTYVNDQPMGVAVDSRGVYVVGYQGLAASNPPMLRVEKRSIVDGSLVWAQVLTDPAVQGSEAVGVAVDGSGVYVVGSQLGYDNRYGWRVEKRSLVDGSLIWNTTSSPSGQDMATGVALDGSGIYVVGSEAIPGSPEWGIGKRRGPEWRIEKRRLTDGSLVWNVTSNPSVGEDVPTSVTVDASGIYVVGIDMLPGNLEWRVEKRHLTDGSLLWNATSNPSLGQNVPYGVTVDDSGIYVVGSDESQGSDNFEWRIEKRHVAGGSLMWNVMSKPGNGAAEARAVAADASGIYVVGYDSSTNPDVHEWRIEKRELGPPVPPVGPSIGGLLVIIAAATTAIAGLAAAAILSKRTAHPARLPRRTGRTPTMVCPRCHRPLSYYALNRRWYCPSCGTYV